MVNSQHTQENMEKVIEREQSPAAPISPDAQKRNADFVTLATENMKAWKLSANLPDADTMLDGFREVANMTPEVEAAMNAQILAELGGAS